MIKIKAPVSHEWWACSPRRGGEWFAQSAISFLGRTILSVRNHVIGPFRTAHGACCECERQMRIKRAAMLGVIDAKNGILS